MKTSNDLTAYIGGFKNNISGNNVLLVPFVRNGLVLYVFNKLSNRNANEAAEILASLQGRHNISIDALKRPVLRLNEKKNKSLELNCQASESSSKIIHFLNLKTHKTASVNMLILQLFSFI